MDHYYTEFSFYYLGFDWQDFHAIGAVTALIAAAWFTPSLKRKNAGGRILKEINSEVSILAQGDRTEPSDRKCLCCDKGFS